jgi:hypothetical protein
MTVLRCERLAEGAFDAAIASLGTATLARTPTGAFIEIEDAASDRARRALAFAGVRVVPSFESLAPRPGTRAAIGRDLTALPLPTLVLDLVHVRALSLGAELTRVMRSRGFRRAGASSRALARELLRGSDVPIGWRRRAWTTREVLRAREVRRVLRPVVFDIGAISAPPERRSFARERSLERWFFA